MDALTTIIVLCIAVGATVIVVVATDTFKHSALRLFFIQLLLWCTRVTMYVLYIHICIKYFMQTPMAFFTTA